MNFILFTSTTHYAHDVEHHQSLKCNVFWYKMYETNVKNRVVWIFKGCCKKTLNDGLIRLARDDVYRLFINKVKNEFCT